VVRSTRGAGRSCDCHKFGRVHAMADREERAERAERTEWPKDRQSNVETARKIWCRSAERGRRAGNVDELAARLQSLLDTPGVQDAGAIPVASTL
jgi:hypothetical protein